MAYDPPTVGLLKGRFPEFGNVPDSLIQMVLDETTMFVDTRWIETDYLAARIHLAAHILHQNGAISAAADSASGDIQIDSNKVSSISVGDVSVSLSQDSLSGSRGASMVSDEGLSITMYGRMFLAIRKRNIPAVAVTS